MLTIDEVKKAISAGMNSANDKYGKWSGGLSIHDHGVEFLLCADIAESLFDTGTKKDGTCYVTLETSFQEIMGYAGVRPRGPIPSILKGRCDVVYYDQKLPRGLVEVKRNFNYAGQKKDIERIARMMQKCETIKWGAVAGMRTLWESDRLSYSEVADNFVEKCSRDFNDFRFRPIAEGKIMGREEFDGKIFTGYAALGALFNMK